MAARRRASGSDRELIAVLLLGLLTLVVYALIGWAGIVVAIVVDVAVVVIGALRWRHARR